MFVFGFSLHLFPQTKDLNLSKTKKMKKLLLCFAVAAMGVSVNSYAQMSQDFEASGTALPTGWADAHVGMGNGWQVHTGGDLTILASAGAVIPSHTNFAYVNDQAAHNNYPAKLSSGTFTLTSGMFLVYDYWFPQYRLTATGRRETGWVELSTDGGSTYSTVDSVVAFSGGWKTKGVAITATASTNCKLRFCYSDNRINATDTAGIIGIGIDNIKVVVPPASEIALTAVTPIAGNPANDFQLVGGTVTFGGTVLNNGGTTITGFTAGYKVGSGSFVSGAVTGLSIAPFTSGTFSCTTPYSVTTLGSQATTIFVRATGDAVFTNDTLSTAVSGVSSFPTKGLSSKSQQVHGAAGVFAVSFTWILFGGLRKVSFL